MFDRLKFALFVVQLLQKIKIPPPSIGEESALRAWLEQTLETLSDLAALTATTIDDMAISAADRLVSDDSVWDVAYRIAQWSWDHVYLVDLFDENQVVGDEGIYEEAQRLSVMLYGDTREVGISPLAILTAIQVIIAMLKLLRGEADA